MILIVADTGPINYLVQIGCVNALSEMVKTVVMPASVLRERQAEGAPSAVREWAENLPVWVEIKNATSLISSLPELSEADREAISLAREVESLAFDGRPKSQTGRPRPSREHHRKLLGILEATAAKGLISPGGACFERLRTTSMFISDELLARALAARFEEAWRLKPAPADEIRLPSAG